MKNLFTSLAVAASALFMVSCSEAPAKNTENAREEAVKAAVTTKTEVSDAAVVWTGYKITGDSHTGTLALKNSSLEFEDGVLKGGTIEIDMATLKNTDLEGEYNQKLVGHLNSDDFFSVATHPTSTFVIASVTPSATEGEYDVKGNLTIKGITKEESIVAKIVTEGDVVTATANFNIDRTKYGVQYGSSNFFEGLGDKAIKDEFNLDVKVVTNLK